MHSPKHEAPTVYLLDGMWPEFDHWIHHRRSARDRIFVPLDGKRSGHPQYGWSTDGFAQVRTHPVLTVWRAFASRRIAGQGAVRQRLAIRFRQRLAQAYVKQLRPTEGDLVITQELLPYVWETGALAHRRYDVLMTSLPMHAVQKQLDLAHSRHPYSTTLADFRAPDGLLDTEQRALAGARRVVTPHPVVAALFAQAELLPWQAAKAKPQPGGTRVLFPAITVGRKGAFEMRAATRELGLPLTIMGGIVEAPDFWHGLDVKSIADDSCDWLQDAAVVVLPSWIENRPGRLLKALAAGVPVVATHACGLPPQPGVHLVAAGDVPSLCAALRPYARPLTAVPVAAAC